jgi:hypothetical protein
LSVKEQWLVNLSLLIPGSHRLTGIVTEVDYSPCPILLPDPQKDPPLLQMNVTDPGL